ncbi:DUF4955 domain-containing protein [Aestuariibaculum suncheonense]|uniref:DUF4955 domain-containing protein n=1 Tax=Aestuariibaculum suncheonense TaxID=1028745 RepID=A0A8J6QIL5_9FLAO|nr:DUF4955 domain-containing protein [Aestuariibaculum suncheonense]MBD0835686.1 DUF4955 domain-containing protein [Aestuariibaculum suncheonense]
MTLNYLKILIFTFGLITYAQNPSALFQDWKISKDNLKDSDPNNDYTPVLPDFSYAGYQHGEMGLPSSFTQTFYNVLDYGAVANDGVSDKAAIMATIAAAEANLNGGIVFFPPGRFIINDDNVDDLSEIIKITKSNIVLKGSGLGNEGTELYQKDNTTHPDMETKDWVCPYLIQFTNNEDSANNYITDVVADAERETYTIQVANTSNILVGQWVELYVKNTSSSFIAEELAPYSTADLFEPQNLKLVNDGVEVREIHKVVSKTAKTITFKEPIHKTVNATYNWKINNFKVLEEVGIQDLKYTGGFIWQHIHHKAPQELYPGEAASGPHAYLSSSGWSGIQFNHVVNSWITNVEFSNMSQVAQFKFSAYCSALDNQYTGNPGHNYISTNSATGCLVGRNSDSTTGIWHGCGLNAVSVGNVLWRNKNPINGNSGMEVHASQPRANLFDVCKGGFFFNMGGSTGALPNHLRHLVLWNFEGVSYQSTDVKSWRPNSETKYAKFLMPIISGLEGFTMTTESNQFQENESPGIHVDEESLYEAQLAYRLNGVLPNWITGSVSVNGVNISSGVLDLIIGQEAILIATVTPETAENKSVSWISNNTAVATVDSEGRVTALSPGVAIITATTNDGNYTATSNVNVNNVALNKSVIVSSEPQSENPGVAAIDGNISTRWSAEIFPQWLEVDLGALKSIYKTELVCLQDRAYHYIIEAKSNSGDTYTKIVDRSSNTDGGFEDNPITDEFTPLEARYVRITVTGAEVYTGEWTSILEFRVFDQTSLGSNDETFSKAKIYPNPFSSEIKLRHLNGNFNTLKVLDILGREIVVKSITGLNEVDLILNDNEAQVGTYILKLIGQSGVETFKVLKK